MGIGKSEKIVRIVLAESDEDDAMLMKVAVDRSQVLSKLDWLKNKMELSDYMYRIRDQINNGLAAKSDMPDLILLDLHISGADICDILDDILSCDIMKEIPVVAVVDNEDDYEIVNRRNFGDIICIKRPGNYKEFIKVVRWVEENCLELVGS